MGRILGIDPGEKRVGAALSDPMRMIASPYAVLTYKNFNDLVTQLKFIIKEKAVDIVVIGLSIRDDGNEGVAASLAHKIADHLKADNLQIVLWDERYTSKMAEQVLRETGHDSKKMRNKVDGVAASFILRDYMNSI